MLSTIAQIVPLVVMLVLIPILVGLKPKTRLEWILAAWFTLAFSLFYYLTGAWFLLSVNMRFVIAGLVLIAIGISFFRLPREFPPADFAAGMSKFSIASYAAPALIFSGLSISALLGYRYSGSPVSLEFPLKDGTYYLAQAGGTTIVNAQHPYGSQIYSLDILQLNGLGRNADGFNQASLDRYAIYGAPIYSPCDGIVATAIDGLEDIQPGSPADTQHPAGNHVYIDCQEEKVQVLLAHMLLGSLMVKQGNLVMVGEPIGRVGNSGNSSEPHLHIHARQGGSLDGVISGIGVPILFDGRFLVRNAVIAD